MTAEEITVRQAGQADLDALIPAYTEASMDEAVSSWLLPDESRRRALAASSFRGFLGSVVDKAEVVIAGFGPDDIAGISIWLHGNQQVFDFSQPDLAEEMAQAYGEYADRPPIVTRLTEERHPGGPHLYLFAMAVAPARRSAGIGSAILRYRLERADREGLPAYLEASAPRNRRLYERHGFLPMGEPITLPYDGPALQPMWREPRR